MKKHDILTPIGVIAGFGAVLFGIVSGGGNLKLFYDFPSILITLGGSFCAILVNYPIGEFKRLMKVIIQTFKETAMDNIEIINRFSDLSRKARREGLLSLEDEINQINDAFLKKGLQMVVDGIEPETIREIMELEIGEMERRHKSGADMLRAWGGYAPAFGMVGTLIGLIIMLANLSDSAKIASGMAAALITTFYGALLAYVLFNPMAANLALKSEIEVANREMMLEGILAIQSGVNPRIVEEKLICYLSPSERDKFLQLESKDEGVSYNG